MIDRERVGAVARPAAVYLGIIVLTLALLDLVLIVTGLFPPPSNPGDPALGWVSSEPTGRMQELPCFDPVTGKTVVIRRNEAGHRTSVSVSALDGADDWIEIAATGDSHSDLCLSNDEMHFGVMRDRLAAPGREVVAFSYGAGRYSPLQEYLAVREPMTDFEVDALVMNLYTGNDFYDILRVDDRPHFVEDGGGYDIAPPVWYAYDPPGSRRWSRVLFAGDAVLDRIGVGNLLTRLRYLHAVSSEQGSGLGAVLAYMNDLRKSTAPEVGYPGAYAAQILNQLLFFDRFPASSEESMRRVRALLRLVRDAHPNALLVMSPIPSYLLVGEEPVDGALLQVFDRLPLSYEEGVHMEEMLYEALREAATEAGWLFVDNLSALRGARGGERLFNAFDYHVTVRANEVIGEAQAEVIAPGLPR